MEIFSSARVLVAQHSFFVGETAFKGRLCDLSGYAGQDGATTQLISSLIESCEVQGHHDRFQSTSGVTQNMPFLGPPFTVLKTHIYIGLF